MNGAINLSEYRLTLGTETRTEAAFGDGFLGELYSICETHARHARKFLEWGAGLSTLLLTDVAALRGGSVVTIENDAVYAAAVRAAVRQPGCHRLVVAHLTGPKQSQSDPELNYSSAPLALDAPFDLIMIDGRRRVECSYNAFVVSHPDTVVLMHDYRRRRYASVAVLFEIVADNPQFRVMRPKPALLRATEAERRELLRQLTETPIDIASETER